MTLGPTAPISSRLLDIGHGLVVAFPHNEAGKVTVQGQDITSTEAYFFKVLKWQRHAREYRELGAIAAGAANALDYDYLGDTGHGAGDDVLRIENDDFLVYHLGVAPRNPNLRVYEKISASNPNRATDHGNRQRPDPTEGDDFGFYTSREIPNAFDPPALTERLSIRNARDGEFLQFGFLADGVDVPDGGSDLILTGRTYKLQPITDRDEQAFLLKQASLDREDQALRTVAVQIGGLWAYDLGEALPDKWGAITGLSQTVTLAGSGGAPEETEVSQATDRRELEAASPAPRGGPTRRT